MSTSVHKIATITTPDAQATTTSGPLLYGFLNISYVVTWIGGLQTAIVILGLIELSLLGAAVSESHHQTGYIGGFTFYAFLFLVAFWCFMTSLLLFVNSIMSFHTSALLPKTTFFSSYHITASFFYLCSSAALLSQTASTYSIRKRDDTEIRGLVITSGVFGVFLTGLYLALTVVGVVHYKRP